MKIQYKDVELRANFNSVQQPRSGRGKFNAMPSQKFGGGKFR
jgi:hypothetical protein